MNKLIKAPNKILDIVYTYVNTTDKKWINKVIKYKPTYGNKLNKERFNFYGEIFFSLKTVEKYMPWVNKIYIVHDNQEFDLGFLSENFRKKIVFVDHREIIPNKYLPVFNSMLIEMFISEIPNLTDYFIYMNDDVFIGNDIYQSFFFHPDGVFKHFLIDLKKEYNLDRLEEEPHLIRLINVHNIVKKVFNKNKYYRHSHAMWPLHKYSLKLVFKLFKNKFKKMLKTQRFRTYNEDTYEFLTLSTIVSEELKLVRKSNIMNKIFIIQKPLNNDIYKSIMRKRPSVFVINKLDKTQEKIWILIQNKYLINDNDKKYDKLIKYINKILVG